MPSAGKYLNNHDSLLIFLQFDQSSQQPEPELKPDAGQQEQPQPEPEPEPEPEPAQAGRSKEPETQPEPDAGRQEQPEPEPAQAGRPELVYLSFLHLNIATAISREIKFLYLTFEKTHLVTVSTLTQRMWVLILEGQFFILVWDYFAKEFYLF